MNYANALTDYLHPAGCAFVHPKEYLIAGIVVGVFAVILYLVTQRLAPTWLRTVLWMVHMLALLGAIGLLFFYAFKQICGL